MDHVVDKPYRDEVNITPALIEVPKGKGTLKVEGLQQAGKLVVGQEQVLLQNWFDQLRNSGIHSTPLSIPDPLPTPDPIQIVQIRCPLLQSSILIHSRASHWSIC